MLKFDPFGSAMITSARKEAVRRVRLVSEENFVRPTRDAGYKDVASALGELIDNAGANATRVKIFVMEGCDPRGQRRVAAQMGVTEGALRYRLKKRTQGELMHALKADAAVPPARLKARRYLNSALLIVDEVGFRPLDRDEANLFFRLISARYERSSVVLTSNKHVRDWLATAILDRLLHHVHVVHTDGRSYRLRELQGLSSGGSEFGYASLNAP